MIELIAFLEEKERRELRYAEGIETQRADTQ